MVFSKKNNFTAQRWSRARTLQKSYFDKTGNVEPLKSFYKNDNKFSSNVFKYEVTFGFNQVEDGYTFGVVQESYTIYSYGASMSTAEIEEQHKKAIAGIFKGRSMSHVYNKLDESGNVTVRGVENKKAKYSDIDTSKLQYGNTYTENMPSVEVFRKNTNGGKTKNKYNLDIWL